MDSVRFSLLPASDVPHALALELAGFPSDEAATIQSLTYRQESAPELFLGAYSNFELIGFICATRMESSSLHHDSMSIHQSTGQYIAIHSICIREDLRRKGIATNLMGVYLQSLQGHAKGVRLITHEGLIPLYEKSGFILMGESSIIHGAKPWFEMGFEIATPPMPQQVSIRSPGLEFAGMEGLLNESGKNKADLFCPRAECRCLLLLAGVAHYVPPSSFALPALPHPLSSVPAPSTSFGSWSIPSPLSFENIGFSKNTSSPNQNSTSIKYLICADCDFGPLGYHDTQGKDLGMEVAAENEGNGPVRTGREFYLDVGRVRYRTK